MSSDFGLLLLRGVDRQSGFTERLTAAWRDKWHPYQPRAALAQGHSEPPPARRLYAEFSYAAASWAQPWRDILKASIMATGDTPRCVVTSLEALRLSRGMKSSARDNGAKASQAVQCDLQSDRTSAPTFLANTLRLRLSCATQVLHPALRTQTRQHTARAQAQPSTLLLTLCKVATQGKQYQDRILLHLPSSCSVKARLHRVTTLLYVVLISVLNRS